MQQEWGYMKTEVSVVLQHTGVSVFQWRIREKP
jgi:hypothetical protein